MTLALYISNELKGLKQFVVWKYEARKGKQTKVPYDAKTRRKANTQDPATWVSYETALEAFRTGTYDGIGFVFTAGFCGIDLDHCRDPNTGEIAPWALEI